MYTGTLEIGEYKQIWKRFTCTSYSTHEEILFLNVQWAVFHLH